MGIDLIFLLFFSLPRRLAKRVVSTPTEKKIYYGYMLLLHYSINKNLDHSYYTCTCIHVYRISAIKTSTEARNADTWKMVIRFKQLRVV